MASDAPFDAYGDRTRVAGYGRLTGSVAPYSSRSARKPLPWRKQQYRKLSQMFARWAETAEGED